MTALFIIGIALAAYFLGGLNGAIITTRLVYHDDIRNHGSGNPGLTNFQRSFGGRAMFLLILIDVLKTALPVVVGGVLLVDWGSFGTVTDRELTGRTLAAFFAMLGHAYPPLYGFKGGKCVLAGGTAVLFIDWRVALVAWGAFLLVVILTRYVSLGSVVASLFFPIGVAIFHGPGWPLVLSTMCALLLIYRHRGNIVRLLRGEERKLSFGRRDKKAPDEPAPEAGGEIEAEDSKGETI